MGQLDAKIFADKKFSDILEEIYTNQNKTKDKVTVLINELKSLIEDLGDATLVVPLIKEYLDIGVKNDDQLIKMAGIIQRVLQYQDQTGGSDLGLNEIEKSQLLDLAKEYDEVNSKNKE